MAYADINTRRADRARYNPPLNYICQASQCAFAACGDSEICRQVPRYVVHLNCIGRQSLLATGFYPVSCQTGSALCKWTALQEPLRKRLLSR